MTLGEKIQSLRKQQGLSQEALAEKVFVTRQTISKWELDQSTPDLDFIAKLSDIFNVSSDYLIKSELTKPDELPFKKRTYRLSQRVKGAILAVISAGALAAALVCLICDYFGTPGLSWSWIAIASIGSAWLLLLPALAARRNIILKTLAVASVVPFPLLAVLALRLERPLIFTLGSCIALVSIAAGWLIYGIFRLCQRRLWRGVGFALLVMIPLPLGIMLLIARFIPQAPLSFDSSLFNSAVTLALSLGCFGADWWFQRRKT